METTPMFLPVCSSRPCKQQRVAVPAQDGFSLLEVMVALAILALAVSLVLPGLGASLATATRQSVRTDVARQILEYRREAADTRTVLTLSDQNTTLPRAPNGDTQPEIVRKLSLPVGWQYHLRKPIAFARDGQCSGGEISLELDGKIQMMVFLEPGRCNARGA